MAILLPLQLISGSWEAIIERWGWQVAKLGQCKRNEGVGGLTGARLRKLTLDQIPKKKLQVPMEIRA